MLFTRRPDWEILEHVCTTAAPTYQEFKEKACTPAK